MLQGNIHIHVGNMNERMTFLSGAQKLQQRERERLIFIYTRIKVSAWMPVWQPVLETITNVETLI